MKRNEGTRYHDHKKTRGRQYVCLGCKKINPKVWMLKPMKGDRNYYDYELPQLHMRLEPAQG